MTAIQLLYLANLVILMPVAIPTLLNLFRTDQGCFESSVGWRVLVGSLWTGIMLLSLLGMWEPVRLSPVLVLQVIYKSLWLLVYALPLMMRREWQRIPCGITISFVAIVIVWPWLIPWRYLLGQ